MERVTVSRKDLLVVGQAPVESPFIKYAKSVSSGLVAPLPQFPSPSGIIHYHLNQSIVNSKLTYHWTTIKGAKVRVDIVD